MPVRELGEGRFEVIDGNHRLVAVRDVLKWDTVPCENFGDISIGEAITISRRRNHEWFPMDTVKYAEAFTNHVLPEFKVEELANFMPESLAELKAISTLLDFDWNQFNSSESPAGTDAPDEGNEDEVTFTIKLPRSQYEWTQMEIDRLTTGLKVSESEAWGYAVCGSASLSIEELKALFMGRIGESQ